MACVEKPIQGYIYTSFSVLWIIFTVWWGINTWMINAANTKSLHKMIFFVALFKTMYTSFFGLSKIYCNSEEDAAYWGLATTSSFTLYYTFIYTTLALISRGFCIIRDTLNRVEFSTIAIIMGIVYLSFSAYLIAQENLAPMILVIVGVLFYSSSSCAIKNIKSLQIRFYNLQQANIQMMLPEISIKISKLKFFLLFSYLFYTNEVVKIALLCIEKTANISDDWFLYTQTSIELTITTISCFGILFPLRQKNLPRSFNNSMIMPVDDRAIAQILSARIPYSDVQVTENVAVVLTPQDLDNSI